jgi:hypothetical protein
MYIQHTDKDFIDMYNVCYNAIEVALNNDDYICLTLEAIAIKNDETRNIPFYTENNEMSFDVVSIYAIINMIHHYQICINDTVDIAIKQHYTFRIDILQKYVKFRAESLSDIQEYNDRYSTSMLVTKRTGDMMDYSTKKVK